MTFSAKDISLSVLADLDRLPKPGHVHSAYKGTVNIICDDMTWISLHPPETCMHPYAIRLRRLAQHHPDRKAGQGGEKHTLLGARPGQRATVSRSRIALERSGTVIDIAAADPWNPYLRPHDYGQAHDTDPLPAPFDLLGDVLVQLLDDLPIVSPFLAVVLGKPLAEDGRWLQIVQAQAGRALQEIETGIRSRCRDPILSGVSRAVGLGPGATPSGDDFLTGFIGAYYFFAYGDEFRQRLFVSVAPLVRKTTLPAFFMLKAALRGLCPEPLAALLYSLRDCGAADNGGSTEQGDLIDSPAIRRAIESLLKIGATSGQDMLAGVLSWLLASSTCGCAYATN
jgi:hypothetical protein